MTLAEFKAWFEGFTEGMDGAPSDKQWERIKKRVKEIDGSSVTERVFIDRYVDRHWPRQPRYWELVRGQYQAAMNTQQSGRNDWDGAQMASQNATLARQSFNSMHAMTALGRTDFEDAA